MTFLMCAPDLYGISTVAPVGLPAGQRFLRLGGVLQRKALVDRHLHRARLDHREQIVGGVLKFLRRARVMRQGRPGQESEPLAARMPGGNGGTGPEELP